MFLLMQELIFLSLTHYHEPRNIIYSGTLYEVCCLGIHAYTYYWVIVIT